MKLSVKIAIIVSQFNASITEGLLKGALKGLQESGLLKNMWSLFEVPGAFEIPFMVQKLIDKKKHDGVIALGCVLRGETDHYAAVCAGVTYGIQKVAIENRLPVMFGVLMCRTEKQALARSSNNKKNKGYECARALVELLQKSEA